MLRPMMVAPMFCSDSSTTVLLSFTSPPSMPCGERHALSGNTHSCSRMPPMPSGFSTLCFGPATKPSSDIEILKRRRDTSALLVDLVPQPPDQALADARRALRRIHVQIAEVARRG